MRTVRSRLAAPRAAAAGAAPAVSGIDPPKIAATPGAYLLYCGGCHGINGHSSDAAVPA